MNKRLAKIVSLPKTIWFNLKMFPIKMAIRLPVYINYNVKIGALKRGNLILENWENNHYRVTIGYGGSKHIIPNREGFFSCGPVGTITFQGAAGFSEGISLRCDYGKMVFGKNFSANRNCCFNCEKGMYFGDDVLFGWNVNVRDTDGHQVYQNGEAKQLQKEVHIGSHSWICSYSDLLKGTVIGSESVVAWRSCVLKEFPEDNVLIGGFPAKILQENITWEN